MNTPLIRTGQGDYTQEYHPGDIYKMPRPPKLPVGTLMILAFLFGVIVGAACL